MVFRIVIDVAGDVLLFESADPVLKTRRSRQRQRSRQCLFIARIRHEVRWIGCKADGNFWQLLNFRYGPRFRAVCEVTIRQIKDRHHVFESQPHRFDRHVEAVCRSRRRDHDRRTLAVASPYRLKQIGLLGLCRQTCRWATALHVDDDERQLSHHR